MGVAFVDLGPMNAVVAMTIAVFKATLVVLFFMHVKYSTRLTWVVAVASVFWLGILLALTLDRDSLQRGSSQTLPDLRRRVYLLRCRNA